MKRIFFILLLQLVFTQTNFAQYSKNANEKVPSHKRFSFGTNLGYTQNWQDTLKADLAIGNPEKKIIGAGATSLRLSLPESFLEKWGYEIRIKQTAYYERKGLKDMVLFIGQPSEEKGHKDTKWYGSKGASKMFKGMYLPIWDNGANGSPINENNHLAVYIYKLTQTYGDKIKYWEIWNEPDYTNVSNASKPQDDPESWWQRNPTPDELVNLHAPIQHYIRALRVCYDVIKSADANDFVCIGGIGYPSFLDAVLRNTDNPNKGDYSSEYPKKGGAYFDCVSYHNYPMYQMKKWNNSAKKFDLLRHSDKGAEILINSKRKMEEVLAQHGYDGGKFPKKEYIITETNVPNLPTPNGNTKDNYIGSQEAQRNYLMKAIVVCKKEGIIGLHTFALNDKKDASASKDPYAHMGFYADLYGKTLGQQKAYPSSVGCSSAMKVLDETTYDLGQTQKLNLPTIVDGAAFKTTDGSFVYALWAKTQKDNTEDASAIYSFPENFDAKYIKIYAWNYAQTNINTGSYTNELQLNGTPIFVKLNTNSQGTLGLGRIEDKNSLAVRIYPQPANNEVSIAGINLDEKIQKVQIIDFQGRIFQLKKSYSRAWVLPNHIADGVYLIGIHTEKQSYMKKIIVRKP